ncbi:twin-arginine translocase subunit TatC [Parasulfitobacter algicola]|uniref:Sec-independent protein translocase protein TatC n=1 Tax=Parasulfitobacter algicola TaxID=2614809 RepID=A0ABX2ITI1_9RHOB|nr:twin-arginine translocase subunit TatC [Sulfitobacter algicola]NSX54385.1 twin-arginine translocase subunit TatC [Sulfitobacter algicola]
MSSTEDEIDDSSAPLIEHLAELRSRLIRAAIAFIICVFACFYVWNPIFNFLTTPICAALADRGQDCSLVLIKLQEGFFVAIRISLLGGFALAFPVISYQLWRFIAPGLYKSERGAFLPFLLASPFMFFTGASFAFFLVIPLAFDFFLNFQQLTATGDAVAGTDAPSVLFQGSIAEYLSLTITFIMAFGLCFQLPVLLSLLGKAGLVTAKGLAVMRKYAVVAILILAGIVTPPDIITQVILFVAVYGLYEISIWLVSGIEKRRNARLREQGLLDDEEDLAGDEL